MNFMFEWQEQYLTRSLRSLVRYCSCHENIKFISSSQRVMFFLLYGDSIQQTISELPLASFSNRVLVLILSYQNEFNLHVNENSFAYERMSTKTRFEKEATGNSEMAYSTKAKGGNRDVIERYDTHKGDIRKIRHSGPG